MNYSLKPKSYLYRIYPNKTQKSSIDQTCGSCRFIKNQCVEDFNNKVPYDERPTIKEMKAEFTWLGEVSASALRQAQMDVEKTEKQYFNNKNRKTKIGRPKFKKKGVSKDSYRLSGATRFKIDQDVKKIKLQKIDSWISYRDSRTIPSDAVYKSVTVIKSKTNKYYVSILVEEKKYPKEKTNKSVGVDLGLKSFIHTSDGENVPPLKQFRENQAKLAPAQRHLSRKRRVNKKLGKKNSKRQEKQRIKVAKINEKTANQRKHAHHVWSKNWLNQMM